MNIFKGVIASTFILSIATFGVNATAQTYQGDPPGLFFTSLYFPDGKNYTSPESTISPGPVTLQFTLDPTALTFQFDSLTFKNLTIPTITTTYPVGFSNGTEATVTISFDPLNFVVDAPPADPSDVNPVPLVPLNGTSKPTYRPSYNGTASYSGPDLTGSYSITSSVGSTSGNFSIPLAFVDISLSPYIQLTGYPNSLPLFASGMYQLEPTQDLQTLFSATIDGTTISPEFTDAEQFIVFGTPVIQSTTFTEVVPEPSTLILILSGLGLLTLYRIHSRRV